MVTKLLVGSLRNDDGLGRYLVEVSELRKWFPLKSGLFNKTTAYLKAVDGVSFGVVPGETMGLVGESGCGKTTLGLAITRLTDVTSGNVFFGGANITKLKGGAMKPFRRKMQVVFQDPYASLDPRQTVKSAITESIRIHRLARSGEQAISIAEELINTVGLNPDHLSRFPHEFSGGQRQRIAIARAISVNPEFLLLDEPTSSLDVSVQAQILNLLKELQRKLGLTYIFASHNLSVIRYMCHRTAVMYLGRIVEIADTEEIFRNPKHPYTLALLSSAPIPDPEMRKNVSILEGDVPSPINMPSGCRFRTRCSYATERCAQQAPQLQEVKPGHWIECHYNIDFTRSAYSG